MRETLIKLPLDTTYLQEFIDQFLKVYNSISVQCNPQLGVYYIKLDDPLGGEDGD